LKKAFKKIIYILPERDSIRILILFILMLIAAALEVAGIGMIPAFVSIVASPERVLEVEYIQPLLSTFQISNPEDLLIWGSIALVLVFLIKSLFTLFYSYVEARFISNRRYKISYRLMDSYMKAPYTFHLQKNTAELLRNITQEVNLFVSQVITNVMSMTKEIVMAVSILVLLFVVEPFITLLVILISGLGTGTFLFLTQKKIKRFGEEEQQHRMNMIKAVNQGLGGIKDARVLNREESFIKKFGIEAYLSSKLLTYKRFIRQVPKPVVETSAVITMMLISAFMIWQGRPMSAIIPILTLFAMATVRLMPAFHSLSTLYTNLKYNIVSINPLYDDLKLLRTYNDQFSVDRKSGKKLHIEQSIEAQNIVFRYPGSAENALDDISFHIQKGDAVAFVGESGAGKTTVVDVILGLLEPTEGEIRVDGINIHKNLSAWQKNIGYIPQTIYLADESLRNNIAFGVPENEIDDDRVMEVLISAQLQEMLNHLPDGLDTMLGEHGTRISGGQRQRVGIARALYHDPEVLVMDEATSALDNITEKEITSAIERLRGDRTIIMIAHRLTTVQNCNVLYLMKEGQIADQGSYTDLVSQNPEFRKMALVD